MKVPTKSVKKTGVGRAKLLGGAAALAADHRAAARPWRRRTTGSQRKMNIGCVGVGGMQGLNDVNSVASENIYALCDVDENYLDNAAKQFPKAKQYRDFREMLDKEQKNLHGITITIPDHMHATVALWAMERGIAVHCQKPLTQTVWEARLLAKAAQKYKVATQMGNQGYSAEATRIACEIIWRGDIGDVTEVHAWNGGGFARGIKNGRRPSQSRHAELGPLDRPGAGAHLQFEDSPHQLARVPGLWHHDDRRLGHPSSGRPTGGCNSASLPTSVECTRGGGSEPGDVSQLLLQAGIPRAAEQVCPVGKMPPVTVYWYEGSAAKNFKPPQGLTQEDIKDWQRALCRLEGLPGHRGRGESYRMVPERSRQDHPRPPEVLKRSPGHFQDWIRACKGGEPACSNFSIAGPYTEWMLLGAISWRFPNEKLLWDGKNLRFTNNEKANEFVMPKFRKGWELKDITV